MPFSQKLLDEALKPWRVWFLPACTSTNTLAVTLVRKAGGVANCPYQIVITDEQTEGRGRLERSWYAPPASALLVSFILPVTDPAVLGQLTMLGAVAVAKTVEHFVNGRGRVGIKWPNDVQVDGRKVSGVLAEAVWEGERLIGAVLGIGLNIRIDFNKTALAERAISLAEVVEAQLPRLDVTQKLVEEVAALGPMLGQRAVFQAWQGRLNMLGQPVQVQQPNGVLQGIAVGVAENGALQVQGEGGRIYEALAGDIAIGQ